MVQNRILVLRGQRVILDADLAAIYSVATKRLIEQMKRNLAKFPEDFVFQLKWEEYSSLRAADRLSHSEQETNGMRSQNATGSRKGRSVRNLPYAFTEHGAIQAANVLNSSAATRMGIEVVPLAAQRCRPRALTRRLGRGAPGQGAGPTATRCRASLGFRSMYALGHRASKDRCKRFVAEARTLYPSA